jgi:Ca-activated chloride channel family protein
MKRNHLLRSILLTCVCLPVFSIGHQALAHTPTTEGQLLAVDAQGQAVRPCPLKHTDVRAEISGFIARVTVTQQFQNPFPDKIEAVYTFPLPQAACLACRLPPDQQIDLGRLLRLYRFTCRGT